MDLGDSTADRLSSRRRSTRLPSKRVVFGADLNPRPPLKRTRKVREQDQSSRAVNGSKETKSLTENDDDDDDESPVKIPKLRDPEEEDGGDGDVDHAEVEMNENVDQDEDMNSEEEAEQDREKFESRIDDRHSAIGQTVNHEPGMTLRSRRSIRTLDPELPKLTIGPTSYSSSSTEPSSGDCKPIQSKSLENKEVFKKRSNITYQDHTNEKRGPLRLNLPESGDRYRQYEPYRIPAQLPNNIPYRQKAPPLKTADLNNIKKPLTSRASPASTSRGCTWYICKLLQWSLILIGLLALSLFAYQSSIPRTDEVQPIIKELFQMQMATLQQHFKSQRPEFWKRSAIHLKRHLQTVNPTEPVSLILTGGLKAEKTLACFARSLASAYSASLNISSILEIDGTTKTAQDSDQVKLDIDTALRKAFEGNENAAVIHRFEELPPGSTLIFYRYCDHENAAYKKVFLAFTVMLSVDKIDAETSLSTVEDMVHDQIKQKFVSSDKSAKFNKMDVDKLSGLWSRISHLILPMAAEEKIEQQGCEV